jgi:hypothetical protein
MFSKKEEPQRGFNIIRNTKEEPKQEFPQLGTKEFNNLASTYFGGKPQEELKTSYQWQLTYPDQVVMDPDGWDRKNYQYSWFEEKITLAEYNKRMLMSTCVIFTPQEEIKPEPNFYEKLKEYFENTQIEKALEDWKKSAHLDNVGPTVEEFIENSSEERLKEAAEMNCVCKTKDCVHYKSFTSGAKSDAARDYWFEKFQKEVEDKTLHAMISIMQEYSIINEASVLQFHKEWINQLKKY